MTADYDGTSGEVLDNLDRDATASYGTGDHEAVRLDPVNAQDVTGCFGRSTVPSDQMSAEKAIVHYYIDAHHAGDRGFADRLAGHLIRQSEPAMLWLDPFDEIVLAIEGSGDAPEGQWSDRLEEFVGVPRLRDLVQRVVTEAGRRFAASLTEGLVPAVSIPCAQRRLATIEDSSGRIMPGRVDWVWQLARRGAVPVMTTMLPNSKDVMHYLTPYKVLVAMLLRSSVEEDAVLFCQPDHWTTNASGDRASNQGHPDGYADPAAADALKIVARMVPMRVGDLGQKVSPGRI